MKTLFEEKFKRGTNYKESFTKEVDQLIKQDLTVEFKNKLCEALCESYVAQTGETPDPYELSRLATWIVEDKTNDPHKVSKTEFPILSHDQVKLRRRREMVSEHIETTTSSGKHRINGKRKPKNFKVFGEYEGGY